MGELRRTYSAYPSSVIRRIPYADSDFRSSTPTAGRVFDLSLPQHEVGVLVFLTSQVAFWQFASFDGGEVAQSPTG